MHFFPLPKMNLSLSKRVPCQAFRKIMNSAWPERKRGMSSDLTLPWELA
jgi:hypothetical protein